MPLLRSTAKTDYLNVYLTSGDVTDVIEWGKEKYPVDALCGNCRFEDAVMLVRKGYRMLHAGCFSCELLDILYDLTVKGNVMTTGQNSETVKAELMNALIDEYQELLPDEVYVIAEEMGIGLYEDHERFAKLIEPVRRDFPGVYEELLHSDNMREHFLPVLLLCKDMTLTRDFARSTEMTIAYEDDISWAELLNQDSDILERSGILDVFENADGMTGEILDTIMHYNPGLISYERYWMLRILIVVRTMREFVHKQVSVFDAEQNGGWEDMLGYDVYPEAKAILRDLERGLCAYVPDQFDPGKTFAVLMETCGYHNHAYDDPEKFLFEYWEEPQACDMDVLKCVSDLVEEFDLFDNAEMSKKYFEECANQWKNWYASMDPAFSEPDGMDFYEERYKRFQSYSDPSKYYRLYGMDVVADFGEDDESGNIID